jgi:hypothetical protein
MTTGTTLMTGLRRIRRIDEHDRHTRSLGFVCNELPQLEEAPTVVAVALRLTHPGALSDARQIFQGNLPLSGLCCPDDLLTDAVVDCAHMACLSAREPFQKPGGFFRAFALERTPDLGIMGTQGVDLPRLVDGSLRIDRHTPAAKINT